MDFTNKRCLSVGMARSGIAAAELLLKKGAKVFLYDAKPLDAFKGKLDYLINAGAVPFMGRDVDPAIVDDMDMLVMSPGVPLHIPLVKRAYEKGVSVIAEMELGYLCTEADFVAISGTNGKTTTTALTGEIFKNAGGRTYVLGNIGVPICEEALETRKGDTIVAETAALQLETTVSFRPRSCALLNVTEDHQDRYGNMENYTNAKCKMFENQLPDDIAVLNWDNEITRSLTDRIKGRLLWFSRTEILENGAFVKDGRIIFKSGDEITDICGTDEVYIPGSHNLENALAAVAMSYPLGVKPEVIAHTLRTFQGVEHRIEFVRTVNGISFINDSKGTNTDATIKAIEAMTAPTVLILGGYDKHSEFEELFEKFTENIRHIVVLGATKDKIVATAKAAGFNNITLADTFEDAVLKAYEKAQEGWNVLLSPACASWDMFESFEVRGKVFKEIAFKL